MDERLYRRGADGVMESVLPTARGKAAALSAYLARGGTPFRNSGRYKKGPNKGRNVDEATARFEEMWAKAPDSVKEKYAGRSVTDLAPSERPSTVTPPTPKAAPHDKDRNGVPDMIQRPRETLGAVQIGVASDAKSVTPPVPGSDAARAAAISGTDERFATADNGDSAMRAAAAMSGDGYKFGYSPRKDLEAVGNAIHGRGFAPDAAVAPPAPSYRPADMRQADEKRIMDAKAANPTARNPMAPQSVAVTPPTPMPAAGTPVTPGMQTDERMHAQGKVNGGPTPVVKAPATPRVNPQTGKPFGYLPEFAPAPVAPKSVAPPTILSQSQINRPRTVTGGVEGRAAAEMRRQAGILANPGTVNPPGLTLGRRMPLDEINRRNASNPALARR